uniref:Uncharacterized protein n=1 Tax=Leersia perrieri TaxID=77586 RepID=A0A0D9WEL7_9ORYZ
MNSYEQNLEMLELARMVFPCKKCRHHSRRGSPSSLEWTSIGIASDTRNQRGRLPPLWLCSPSQGHGGRRRLRRHGGCIVYLDRSTPHATGRWVATLAGVALRVYLLQGFYIVTFFISPMVDPEANAPVEFKPFTRRLPEFNFWSVLAPMMDLEAVTSSPSSSHHIKDGRTYSRISKSWDQDSSIAAKATDYKMSTTCLSFAEQVVPCNGMVACRRQLPLGTVLVRGSPWHGGSTRLSHLPLIASSRQCHNGISSVF